MIAFFLESEKMPRSLAYPADETGCVGVKILGEFQIIFENALVHLSMIFRPERCLFHTHREMQEKNERFIPLIGKITNTLILTIPQSISKSKVPRLHQSTA